MPIIIPNEPPARAVLQSENIFVMHEKRAVHQDIRETPYDLDQIDNAGKINWHIE